MSSAMADVTKNASTGSENNCFASVGLATGGLATDYQLMNGG